MNNNGILLHITSIYNELGVGDLGASAYDFIDFLASNKFNIWSILPLTETNKYNSPYSSQSSYGFETDWIDLKEFIDKGLLSEKEYFSIRTKPKRNKVNLTKYRFKKKKILDLIFSRLEKNELLALDNTLKNDKRLFNFCLFKSLLEHFKTTDWRTFDEDIKTRTPQAIDKYSLLLKDKIYKYAYFQEVFKRQFIKLKEYANNKNIQIWGDLPIYLEVTAFDIWENPKLVLLDKQYEPLYYGGSPSDGMNPIQNWKTCIYDWHNNKDEVYNWWKKRIENQLQYFDKIRLDHYIGLINCYMIPSSKEEEARWESSGGLAFFEYLLKDVPQDFILIEDLGILSKECIQVKNKLKLLGMSVIQFNFANDKDEKYLKSKKIKDIVLYCGTHDNNTILGYLNNLTNKEKNKIKKYYGIKNKINDRNLAILIINSIFNSNVTYKLFQLQDLLLESSRSRMNIPGTVKGNWNYVTPKEYKDIYNINKEHFPIDKIFKKRKFH